MKAKIKRSVLEIGLSKCFDACEKKASESITQFVFEDDTLNLSSKGGFSYINYSIKDISFESNCKFALRTSAILDFVKYIDAEEILLIYDSEKQSCIISSSDKKSKIAFQIASDVVEDSGVAEYDISFSLKDSNEFINKLYTAAKFCSYRIEDHPLTGIHCLISKDNLEIKSTNGPAFFKTSFPIECQENFEFYLHKKTPLLLKTIISDSSIKCSINKNHFFIKTDNCNFKVFIESCEKDSFPTQVTDWLDKKPNCAVKVSTFELMKTLKYLNNLMGDNSVKISTIDTKLSLESSQTNLASKEFIAVENLEGNVNSEYNIKLFVDCIDSFKTSWIKLDFISMQSDFNLCKITGGETTILLCPITS